MTGPGALTFVVGITGHRDIPKPLWPLIKEHVSAQLQQIKANFSSLPVEVVCGLAEGADTLVAEVALELGMAVRAVLPMPISDYEEDFSEDGLATFRRLINTDEVVVEELPLSNSSKLHRDSQYLMLKDYLVRRSNVLMALWDGVANQLPGGTSDVALSYLTGSSGSGVEKVTRESTLGDDENLVISIFSPREWSDDADGQVGFEYLMSEGSPGCIASLLDFPKKVSDRWVGFERYASERFSDNAKDIVSYDFFVPEDAEHSPNFERLNGEFVRADQLAIANQTRSDFLFKSFGLMAGSMGLFFLIYAKLSSSNVYLVAYLVLFAVGYVLFRVSRDRAWFSKHLAYRAFAETIRIRYFLELAGCGHSTSIEDHLKLMKVNRFNGLEWLYDAAKSVEPLPSAHTFGRDIAAVRKRWVEDQSGYFKKKVHQLHHEHERLEMIKRLLFIGSFLGTLALVFFKKDLYHLNVMATDGKTFLVFLMGLLPLWLALWELYQGKMAVRELAWQYSNQALLFSEASRRLETLENEDAKLTIIEELADTSLIEALQWTVHRFHRDHEPPTAG